MKAFILAGGYGTRLGELTKDTPKPMLEVAGKPILLHIIEHLNRYGIFDVLIKVSYKREKIMEYFGGRVLYYYEPLLLEPEQSVLRVHEWLGDKFFVLNGDTITNVNLFSMMQFASACKYIGNAGRFGGTELVDFNAPSKNYFEKEAYYFDCGTPDKLEKARNFFDKK